jgi:hypothetical protein
MAAATSMAGVAKLTRPGWTAAPVVCAADVTGANACLSMLGSAAGRAKATGGALGPVTAAVRPAACPNTAAASTAARLLAGASCLKALMRCCSDILPPLAATRLDATGATVALILPAARCCPAGRSRGA